MRLMRSILASALVTGLAFVWCVPAVEAGPFRRFSGGSSGSSVVGAKSKSLTKSYRSERKSRRSDSGIRYNHVDGWHRHGDHEGRSSRRERTVIENRNYNNVIIYQER